MTSTKKIALAAAGAMALAATGAAPAQESHSSHDMGAKTMKAESPSTDAYKAAMDKMQADMMAMKYSGDADVDFVKGLIPHHQGAIDMAKVVLEHGKDPEISKLAEDVIKAQEAEIKQMQDWLKTHEGK